MQAELMLDAMPEKELVGRVTEVSEYPLPAVSVYMDHVKEYEVAIEIDAPPQGLRPGMTAEVRVFWSKRSTEASAVADRSGHRTRRQDSSAAFQSESGIRNS